MTSRLVQRREALDRATSVKLARADAMRDLYAGRLDPFQTVLDPPECVAGMMCFEYLLRVPGINRRRLQIINRAAIVQRVNLTLTLEDLTPARRQWLVGVMRLALTGRRLSQRPQG